MDYCDAIDEVIEKAKQIKLPGDRFSVVTEARREFGRHGACNSKYMDPIEGVLRECLKTWTLTQKQEIWSSTETGWNSLGGFEDYDEASIHMDLEAELLGHIIEELSPPKSRRERHRDDDFEEND